MIKSFAKQYRVELITFVVALTLSLGYLVWNEMGKPNGGLLRYLRPEARILHKETGEILATGPTRRRAVERHLERLYGRWPRDIAETMPRDMAGRISGWDERDLRRWRERLEGAALRNEDFSSADFRQLHLRNAQCDNANFQFALLLHSNLEGTTFSGANFEGAALGKSDLSNTDLSSTNCTRADFSESQLEGANFSYSNLSDALFIGATCTNANFEGAIFSDSTIFRDAQLDGARNVSEGLRQQIIATGGHFSAPESAPM